MALTDCPECGGQMSDKALMCPHCGYATGRGLYGYEYRSKAELFGLPLLHIVVGPGLNLATGKPRIAKGIIAIGNIAVGLIAMGGLAIGGLSLGGLALGLFAFGGCALGAILAVGGLAVGLVAIGGAAVGYYALGGAAFGKYALGENQQSDQAVEFFKSLLGDWVEKLRR